MRWENYNEMWYSCPELDYYSDISLGVGGGIIFHTCHHYFIQICFFLTYYVYTGTAIYMETYLIHVLFVKIFHHTTLSLA
jgi:hypothetical protein